jgi:hypothetical protein
MTQAVRFRLPNGSSVLFEVDEDAPGLERVSRGSDGVAEASRRLGESLDSVRNAAQAALDALKSLSPQKLELEFGVKLTAEAGALIAKTAAEGHFVVTVTWQSDDDHAPDVVKT